MTGTVKAVAQDRVRQVVVTLSEVFCVIGTLYGVGVLGTRVEMSSGGSFSAQATLLAPAVPAFSIWSVIYAGLLAYVIWQWLPANTTSQRARDIGWLAAVSMILNAGWLLVTQAGWIWGSVVVIVALLVDLIVLVRRLDRRPDSSIVGKIVVDGTFGLYLGWVTIATVANVTTALVSSGLNPGRPVNEWVAVAILAVAAVIGAVQAKGVSGRITVAAALTWGLAWIAVGRLSDKPVSALTGYAAIVAAAVVWGAVVWVRTRAAAKNPSVTA